jgi:hypothetical protein
MISHYASLIGISSQDYWQQVKELRMPRPKRRDEHELAFTIIASKLSHLQEQQRHRSCQREQERTNVPTPVSSSSSSPRTPNNDGNVVSGVKHGLSSSDNSVATGDGSSKRARITARMSTGPKKPKAALAAAEANDDHDEEVSIIEDVPLTTPPPAAVSPVSSLSSSLPPLPSLSNSAAPSSSPSSIQVKFNLIGANHVLSNLNALMQLICLSEAFYEDLIIDDSTGRAAKIISGLRDGLRLCISTGGEERLLLQQSYDDLQRYYNAWADGMKDERVTPSTFDTLARLKQSFPLVSGQAHGAASSSSSSSSALGAVQSSTSTESKKSSIIMSDSLPSLHTSSTSSSSLSSSSSSSINSGSQASQVVSQVSVSSSSSNDSTGYMGIIVPSWHSHSSLASHGLSSSIINDISSQSRSQSPTNVHIPSSPPPLPTLRRPITPSIPDSQTQPQQSQVL